MDRVYYDVSLYESVSNAITILSNKELCTSFSPHEKDRMEKFVQNHWHLTGKGVIDIINRILPNPNLSILFSNQDKEYMAEVMNKIMMRQIEAVDEKDANKQSSR